MLLFLSSGGIWLAWIHLSCVEGLGFGVWGFPDAPLVLMSMQLPDYSTSKTASPPTVHRRERLFEGGGEEARSPGSGHAASQDDGVDEEQTRGFLEGMSIGENGEGEEDFAGVPRSLREGGGVGGARGEGHEVLIAAMEDLCEELKLARYARAVHSHVQAHATHACALIYSHTQTFKCTFVV